MIHVIRVGLLLVLTIVSFQRNTVWRNERTLWTDTTTKSPNKARGYNELGLYASAIQDYKNTFPPLIRSLELNPYQPAIYINLGVAYEGLNQWDKALEMYGKAISLMSDEPEAYYNMGRIYYNEYHDRTRALNCFLKARELNPLEPDVHQYLAFIYHDQGNIEDAQKERALYEALK